MNKIESQPRSKTIHLALSDAIVDYCKRHYISTEQFSDILKHEDCSNTTHEKECKLLDTLDSQARKIYFQARLQEWGMSICKEPSSLTKVEISLDDLADDAMIESSESFTSVKVALEDGELSQSEAQKIEPSEQPKESI